MVTFHVPVGLTAGSPALTDAPVTGRTNSALVKQMLC